MYSVKSNEELPMLLAAAPGYNFVKYQVLTLAETSDSDTVLRKLNNELPAAPPNPLLTPWVAYQATGSNLEISPLPLYALKPFFKLRYQRCFASLQTIASHDAPEIIATWPRACVVHRQQIFGRPARH